MFKALRNLFWNLTDKQVIATFLIPIHDNNGRPYARSMRQDIEAELTASFGGWTRSAQPLSGQWHDGGNTYSDESFRYEIAMPAHRVDELASCLAETARELRQEAIYLVIMTANTHIVKAAR